MVIVGDELIWNVSLSFLVILLAFIFYKVISAAIARNNLRKKLSKRTNMLARKSMRWAFISVSVALLIVLWGGSLENFWMSLTGIFGIIAIGFFAVWSILSNVVSGIVILTSKNINIDDNIEIINEGIKGKIVDINSMFVILKSGKDKIQIPNNLLLQKAVKIKIRSDKEFLV